MKKIGILFLLLCYSQALFAQVPGTAVTDTLRLTLKEAEQAFIEHNLQLLAAKFNIEASRAAVLQAGLWENPNVSYEQNVYNPATRHYFDAGRSGQYIIQLQQLFYLAGKRSKRIKIEQLNSQITEYEFYELLRALKFELRSNFYDLYYSQQALKIYAEKIAMIGRLVNLFEGQYKKGNVALKELTRLKALLFGFQNDDLELSRQIIDEQASLRLLTRQADTRYLLPVADPRGLDSLSIDRITYPQLQELARENRYDLKAYEANTYLRQAQYTYQKSLAVPDVVLGGTFDKAGSYIPNYYALTMQIKLPLLNRNQGGIKIAESMVEQGKVQLEQYRQQVDNEVLQVYRKAQEAEKLYRESDQRFGEDFNRMMNSVLENYEKRNISLLEFTDYYETYMESIMQINRLRNSRIHAFEHLSFVTGKNVFNP